MARKDDVAQKLRALLPDGAVSVDETCRTGAACTARCSLGDLRAAASAFQESGFYLDSITGLDFTDTFEVVYHFNCYEPASRIALRALCAREEEVPTLSDIFASAMWQEREVHEFFGIPFGNHPDLRPLLLPEDADDYPLRKTFGVVSVYRKREEIYG